MPSEGDGKAGHDAPVASLSMQFASGEDVREMLANISAVVADAEVMFLGSDEGVLLERLVREGPGWGGHERIALADLIDLKSADEADIEGLAEDDGWLWVVGSHARARPKLEPDDEGLVDVNALAVLKAAGPRCLLARMPLSAEGPMGLWPVRRDGKRRAGLLKQTKAGNSLAKRLADDPLIGPFTRVGAKEGGLDIEGIAVAGTRVALGLRGPVIRTYAVLIELQVRGTKDGELKLGSLHKRLLDLEGLGIRDLKRVDRDLLILAGPTTGLDGPCRVYRWVDWLGQPPVHEGKVQLHRPKAILELPFGRGDDHPEGMTVMTGDDGKPQLLIVCDSPSAARLDGRRRMLRCDLFGLPI